MEATKVTADELARNLADIMERVIVNREHFLVIERGVVIAELKPGPKRFTVADFKREFGDQFVPKGLGRAIEEGKQLIWTRVETPWYLDGDEE